MRRREPWSTATLEEGKLAPTAHCECVFRCLGWHRRRRLIAYSLVFEDPASTQDPDSDTDSDGPGTDPGGLGPRVAMGGERSGLPFDGSTAELEWDPTGDVGGLGILRSKTVWTPGSPCEVCGRVEPPAVWSLQPWSPPRSLHTKDKKQPSPQDVTVQISLGSGGSKERGGLASEAQPRWTRSTLLFLLLLLLLGVACLLPPPGGLHCPSPWLRRPMHLVLSYVNGPPPT